MIVPGLCGAVRELRGGKTTVTVALTEDSTAGTQLHRQVFRRLVCSVACQTVGSTWQWLNGDLLACRGGAGATEVYSVPYLAGLRYDESCYCVRVEDACGDVWVRVYLASKGGAGATSSGLHSNRNTSGEVKENVSVFQGFPERKDFSVIIEFGSCLTWWWVTRAENISQSIDWSKERE